VSFAPRRRVALTAAAVLSSLALAACGSSSSDGGSSSAAAGSGDSGVTLLKAGTLQVCTHLSYKPFQFKDDSGAVVGFDVDLMDLVAKKLGAKQEIVDIDFAQITSGAVFAAKKCDAGAAATTGATGATAETGAAQASRRALAIAGLLDREQRVARRDRSRASEIRRFAAAGHVASSLLRRGGGGQELPGAALDRLDALLRERRQDLLVLGRAEDPQTGEQIEPIDERHRRVLGQRAQSSSARGAR